MSNSSIGSRILARYREAADTVFLDGSTPWEVDEAMLELGKLGRKTGAGWCRYLGGAARVDDPIVADLALEEAHFAGIRREDDTADEIRERLLLAMINEAASILDKGIADSACEIDQITVVELGFPAWRGGLTRYADTLGAQVIVDKLKTLSIEDPVAWHVSPLLLRCAKSGANNVDAPVIHLSR